MKRIGKALVVLLICIVAYAFIENVLEFEMEPYYLLMIFILVASSFGLFEQRTRK